MESTGKAIDRRSKDRFEIQRELRYKVTGDGVQPVAGKGNTVNLCSAGVAFTTEHQMQVGAFVELSISWPALLDDNCPMRLITFGRIIRRQGQTSVCSIDKYEFRTAPRTFQVVAGGRSDAMLQRWAAGMRKDMLKEAVARA